MPDTSASRRPLHALLCCTVLILLCAVGAAVGAVEQTSGTARIDAAAAPAAPLAPPAAPVAVEAGAPAAVPEAVVVAPAGDALPSPSAAAPAAPPLPIEPAVPAPPAAGPADPAPPTASAPPPSPIERVVAVFTSSVPAAWRSAVPVRFELVTGPYSWANHDGTIQVSFDHADGQLEILQAAVAHEFGHLIAYAYGSQAFNGAAPAGWPAYSSRPEEAWADCVAQVFTGLAAPSHGLPACSGASLDWAAAWLAQGPGAHAVTG